MGLTIHYDIKTRIQSVDKINKLMQKMHQLAKALPFEEVGEIRDMSDDRHRRTRWIGVPWSCGRNEVLVTAERTIGFTLNPGPGSEGCAISLSQFPRITSVRYKWEDDQRFRDKTGHHDWVRMRRYEEKHPEFKQEEWRDVPTKLRGWQGGDFCKTQYAADFANGGSMANFARCHLSLITLLERIKHRLPGVDVYISDEGEYGAYEGRPGDRYHDLPALLRYMGAADTEITEIVDNVWPTLLSESNAAQSAECQDSREVQPAGQA